LLRLEPAAQVDDLTDGFAAAAPVGSFPAGPRGIHDGYGNVNEWLWDPGGPGLRWTAGGQWAVKSSAFRFAFAAAAPVDHRDVTMGLRLARDLP
jgi:formylglycine-generating enzyme required for sulfatase activity